VVSIDVVDACQFELAGQGVDLVDPVDELTSTLGESASWRVGRFGKSGRVVVSERGADSIGVSAVEKNEVFVGLGDVDEDSSEKLEGVVQGIVVELASGFAVTSPRTYRTGAARIASLLSGFPPTLRFL
jgi:hypothetical protein